METRIVPTQVSHAVTLAQTSPTDWAWRVLTIDGAEAVAGQSTREDVAREHAEFFSVRLIDWPVDACDRPCEKDGSAPGQLMSCARRKRSSRERLVTARARYISLTRPNGVALTISARSRLSGACPRRRFLTAR